MSVPAVLLRRFQPARLIERAGGSSPAERLAALRLLIGGFALGYLLLRGPHLLSYASFAPRRFAPVGIVGLLASPLSSWLHYALYVGTVVFGAAFVFGARFRLSAPIFAVLLLWVTSYRNSWGMVFHTENLMVLHVGLLALFPAADAWSLDGRWKVPAATAAHGWGIFALSLITALTYVVAGVAKLSNTGIEWAFGDVLRAQVAYDNLRKLELGSFHSPVGSALVPHAWVFTPLAAATLAVELLAPLCLLSGRASRVWASCAWGFHVGVVLLMAIFFPYQLLGVAYLSFFAVERLPGVSWVGQRLVGEARDGSVSSL